jgi:sec-independent protein translocase protein TatB
MNIFSNIGITELIVILLLALLVVGPDRLPEMGRQLAKILRDVRKAYENLTRDLGPELMSIQETTRELRDSVDSVRSIPRDMVDSVVKAADLDDTIQDLKGVEDSLKGARQSVNLAGDLLKKPLDEAVETARSSLQPPKAGGKDVPRAAGQGSAAAAATKAGITQAAEAEATPGEAAQGVKKESSAPASAGALSQAAMAAMTRLAAGQEEGEAAESEEALEEQSDE